MQKGVASSLAALDDRITLLRETNATLEAIAQALFKSWFVDFDPSAPSATASPRRHGRSHRCTLSRQLRRLEVGGGADGVAVRCGGDPAARQRTAERQAAQEAILGAGQHSWFKTGEFNDGFLLESSEQITEAALTHSSVKLLPAGAVLMAIYAAPTVGWLGVTTTAATFNQACTGMVAKMRLAHGSSTGRCTLAVIGSTVGERVRSRTSRRRSLRYKSHHAERGPAGRNSTKSPAFAPPHPRQYRAGPSF